MPFKMSVALICVLILLNLMEVIPIQMQANEGEEFTENNVENSQLNDCISTQRSTDLGVCFGKDLLNRLSNYEALDSFSLATGVSFVRDDKTPREFGNILDKDPMDFRAIMEDASNIISKRSLHWDLSTVYPGLVMRIGPTLANGILEFVMDPKIKDRTYQHSDVSTGRLLARNLLVPFLLGFKFQLSTLLPLILGLVLLASKKAFVLAKLALLAMTVFGGGFSSNYGYGSGNPSFGEFNGPSLSSYTSSFDNPGHFHGHHGSGYYHRNSHSPEYNYREKPTEHTTATPITPDELRDRLERLFITKKEIDEPREDTKIRNARNFAWTPINT